MSEKTGFFKYLKNLMNGRKSMEVTAETVAKYIDEEQITRLVMEEFTIHAAINMIANCISKCEFKTFENGKEVNKEEYYAWNLEPNLNQNSSQFIQEIVSRLLYNNECLVIESKNQLMIAEAFAKEEYALKETIFNGVSRKGFTFNRSFRMSEVLSFQLNNKNIRKLLSDLCIGYDDILTDAIDKYKKAGGEKGILNIDAIAQGEMYGNKTFEEVYEDLMNVRFKRFFNSRSAVLPLHRGFTYTKQAAEQSKKSTSEVKDITDVLDEIVETVARAFNMPAGLLKGDIADIEKLTKNFLTFCIDPICEMMQNEINRKRYGKEQMQKGNYIQIDTTRVMHTDIFEIAEKIDKLIACGMYCIDELRKKLGDAELNTEQSKTHWITKNYSDIRYAEGGEESAQLGDEIQI